MPIVPKKRSSAPGGVVAAPQVDVTATEGRTGAAQRKLQQIESISSSVGAISQTLGNAKRKADSVRVTDAMNQYQLLSGKLSNEYANMSAEEGLNAQGLPDEKGDPLAPPEHYVRALQEGGAEISSKMKLTPDQQVLFGEKSGAVDVSMYLNTERKYNENFIRYSKSMAEGALKINMAAGAANWDGAEEQLNENLENARTATVDLLVANGDITPESKQAALAATDSTFHANVVTAALNNKAVGRASSYMKKHGSKILMNDRLKLNTMLKDLTETTKAQEITASNAKVYSNAVTEDQWARLNRVVSAGAVQSIEVPKDMSQFGSTLDALTVLNVGEKAYNKAKAESDKSKEIDTPRDYLPKNEVERIMAQFKQFNNGAEATPLPTVTEVVATALAQLDIEMPNASPELRALVIDGAEKLHKRIITSDKQLDERAQSGVDQQLIANGGNLGLVTSEAKADLAARNPEMYAQSVKLGKVVAGTVIPEFNNELYIEWMSDPTLLARMSDADFTRTVITEFPKAEVKALTKVRADALSDNASEALDSLNNSEVQRGIDNALWGVGVNPKPGKRDASGSQRVANMTRFIRNSLIAGQQASGKRYTDDQVAKEINRIVTTEAPTEGWFINDVELLVNISVGEIPKAAKTSINWAFTKDGGAAPTDAEMLEAYRRWRIAGKI